MAKKTKNMALPGMEDRTIDELEDAGAEYAAIRDQRMQLTRQEVELKARTKKAMKKYKRTRYLSSSIEIEIQPPSGEENVKVRVLKPKAERGKRKGTEEAAVN